ncbi:hypothetical protein [Parvularcula sp. IMCC14364]|uniref:hypothetical protein n=1 Tax=Parvularcula sp. IMCC14364 TaxID=3067902 RepID=UPI002740AF19|nr:hypothetical protein [Parvularcula sp. IMCC14364]
MSENTISPAQAEQRLSSPADDLAMIRELAEEGRMQPLQGGKYLVMWGIISSIGLAFTGLLVSGLLDLPGYSVMIFWGAVSTFGGVMSGRWSKQGQGTTLSESIGSKVEAMVWTIAGVFLSIIAIMLFSMPIYAGPRLEAMGLEYGVLFGMMSPIVFGLYAICLAATSVAGRAPWLRPFVILAFLFSALTMLLIMSYWQFVAAIIGVLATTVVPGLIMLDKNRKAQGQIAQGMT